MVHVVKTLWGLRLTLTNNPTLSSLLALPPPFPDGSPHGPPALIPPCHKARGCIESPSHFTAEIHSYGTFFLSDLVMIIIFLNWPDGRHSFITFNRLRGARDSNAHMLRHAPSCDKMRMTTAILFLNYTHFLIQTLLLYKRKKPPKH